VICTGLLSSGRRSGSRFPGAAFGFVQDRSAPGPRPEGLTPSLWSPVPGDSHGNGPCRFGPGECLGMLGGSVGEGIRVAIDIACLMVVPICSSPGPPASVGCC
jgi:hypothetical protein